MLWVDDTGIASQVVETACCHAKFVMQCHAMPYHVCALQRLYSLNNHTLDIYNNLLVVQALAVPFRVALFRWRPISTIRHQPAGYLGRVGNQSVGE